MSQKEKIFLVVIGILTLLLVLSLGYGFYMFSVMSSKLSSSISSTISSTTSETISSTFSSETSSVSTQSESSSDTTTTVGVFFPKDPSSFNDFSISVKVLRTTKRADVGTFAIEELIKGPTAAEKTSGLFTPIKLTGTSNCAGKDFRLSVNNKIATLKFCKSLLTAGIGDDARITNSVSNTLLQFSTTVEKVVILDMNENCFGDMSGENLCKN